MLFFSNIPGSLWEQLDQGVKSFKAVLLNMFQPDRDVLHHLTFGDNYRVGSWPERAILFPNREHSAPLMAVAEWLVMSKERDNRSREVRHSILLITPCTLSIPQQSGQSVGCTFWLPVRYLIWCYTDIFLSQLTGSEMLCLPIYFFPPL